MKIAAIDAFPLNMTFIPEVEPYMLRAATHGEQFTVYRVRLDNGAVGWGDGHGRPGDLSGYLGRNALELLHGWTHGALQMACYDAVGRALGVPAHVLMGRQQRNRVPFAHWTIDLPPNVFAQQTRYASGLGYKSYKFKCRPWWDAVEQVAAAAKAAPPGFRFWLDFNGHLRDSRQALRVLRKIAEFDCVGGIESPIPQRDIPGYKWIRKKLDIPIAVHYGSGCCHVQSDGTYDQGTTGEAQIRENLCDGFVLGGDVDRTLGIDAICYEHRKSFWIQVVGTSLQAAFVAHLASVCRQGLLSHLAAHDLWVKDVVREPLKPVDGFLPVPEGPGLGIEPDEKLLSELVGSPPRPALRRISTVVYSSGLRWHFANEIQRHEAFYFGQLPGFETGIKLDVRGDDGSSDFDQLYKRCQAAPVVEAGSKQGKSRTRKG